MLILSKYLFIKPYHLTMYRHISVQWIDLMIFCLNFTFQLMELISRTGKADIASVLATSSHHISLGAHLKWKFYITANSKFSTQELKLLMNWLKFFSNIWYCPCISNSIHFLLYEYVYRYIIRISKRIFEWCMSGSQVRA